MDEKPKGLAMPAWAKAQPPKERDIQPLRYEAGRLVPVGGAR